MLRQQGSQVLLAGGVVICALMLSFQAVTFFPHYASEHMGYSLTLVLLVGVAGGVCAVATAAVSAILSDSYGRRRVTGFAVAIATPWAFVVFQMIETRNHIVFGAAIMATYALGGGVHGPAGCLPSEYLRRAVPLHGRMRCRTPWGAMRP